MSKIDVYINLWNYLQEIGEKTIKIIEREEAWDYRINQNEFTVLETFNHTLRTIFEDAGNWLLKETIKFQATDKHIDDLEKAVFRMIKAIRTLTDSHLNETFKFQWGEESTMEGAIQQNLYHAIGHFAQLRERSGIKMRTASLKE
ncbi:MAG: hypothetical protein HZR80_08605 [Candidatus Heimdallarchaeota archaeon]